MGGAKKDLIFPLFISHISLFVLTRQNRTFSRSKVFFSRYFEMDPIVQDMLEMTMNLLFSEKNNKLLGTLLLLDRILILIEKKNQLHMYIYTHMYSL